MCSEKKYGELEFRDTTYLFTAERNLSLLCSFLPPIRVRVRNDVGSFVLHIVRSKLVDRIKATSSKLVAALYTLMIDLNIFPLWVFGNKVNRMAAIRLGQWATRLYILLLVIILSITIFYVSLRPQVLTKTFNKPSFNVYTLLVRDHEDTLQCSCSSISSSLDRFVQIEPEFHEVR